MCLEGKCLGSLRGVKFKWMTEAKAISFPSKTEWICGHYVDSPMLKLIGLFTYICLGYGGFVPRTHELFGKDYEHVTHDALNLFTDERKKQEMVLTTPVSAAKNSDQYFVVLGLRVFWLHCCFRLRAVARLYNLAANSVRNMSEGDDPPCLAPRILTITFKHLPASNGLPQNN